MIHSSIKTKKLNDNQILWINALAASPVLPAPCYIKYHLIYRKYIQINVHKMSYDLAKTVFDK